MTDADKIKMLREALQTCALKAGMPYFPEHRYWFDEATVKAALATTAPTQPEPERDERAEFDRWHTKMAPDFRRSSSFNEHEKSIAWNAWQARAALERK